MNHKVTHGFSALEGTLCSSASSAVSLLSCVTPTVEDSQNWWKHAPILNKTPKFEDSLCIPRFDPGLGIIAPINPMMAGISLVPPPPVPPDVPVIKEIIHCKSCTLFPQNPNLPPPSTRERPPGCRTVFVGGLPENATEDIIREVFDQCGEITAIRKSKKNFCHIRYSEEFMIDKAIYLSGEQI
ncbi:Ecto-NOX disulfide-thiol exchanger 1 [Ataeniobius toweri]|uniref:Ecto-NOX disulfide-thiol exchanger 1 n=1 Tax=Ataeniobius toweri TaxID=208326 RepID=A0ABU7BQR9_9TELE|nr:Ecto-NOX disulfide-thiol exchanger 1 [Ataeniobius toweri]